MHDYTDVECTKITPINEASYTIDAEEWPSPIAPRIQGNGTNRLILDPIVGKEYPYPEGSNGKINFVILCNGTVVPRVDPPGPPIETDGPAQAPGPNAGLIGGFAALAGGAALLAAAGVRRRNDER